MGQMPSVKSQLNSSHDSALSNGWGAQQQMGDAAAYHQPLYANAPPKPRRLANDQDEYGAPSPDEAKAQEEMLKALGYEPRIAQPQEPVSPGARSAELRYHYHIPAGAYVAAGAAHPAAQVPVAAVAVAQVSMNAERRTPDTYGRSNSATPAPAPTPKKSCGGGDYEDVYNPAAAVDPAYAHLYRRHSSQMGPVYAKGMPPQQLYGTIPGAHAETIPPVPPHGAQFVHQSQQAAAAAAYATYRYASPMPLQELQPTPQAQSIYGTHPAAAVAAPAQQHAQQGRHHSRSSRHPPRPHSADFLEYDARRHQQQQAYQQHSLPHPHRDHMPRDHSVHSIGADRTYADPQKPARLQRPKSSLDVMPSDAAATDSYYWSEESYAQKMRQSASYVHQIPMTPHHRNQSASSRATTPSVRMGTPSGMSAMTTDSMVVQQTATPVPGAVNAAGGVNSENAGVVLRHSKRTDHIPVDPRVATDPRIAVDARMSAEHRIPSDLRIPTDPRMATDPRMPPDPRIAQDPRLPSDPRIPSESRIPNDPRSPSRPHYQQLQQRRWSEYTDPRANGQFIRSASARLPRQRYQDDEDDSHLDEHRQRSTSDVRDGERKIQQREESMKRLLEWKQRMLQSPLTRKPSGSSNRGTAQNELSRYYKQQQQVLRELATQEAQAQSGRSREDSGSGGRSTRRRPMPEDSHTIPGPGRSAPRSRSQDGRRSSASVNRYNSFSSDDEASGSGSVIGRDPLPPRAVSTVSIQQQLKNSQPPIITLTTEDKKPGSPYQDKSPTSPYKKPSSPIPADQNGGNPRISPSGGRPATVIIPNHTGPSYGNVPHESALKEHRDIGDNQGKRGPGGDGQSPTGLNVSAGELLGRTHEELVLLLIQLRRQSAGVCKAMETCHMEIEAQARLADLETPKRLEHLRKLEELKKHLLDLEKQYEKGKPLVNLVDNMVKLGSLYRGSAGQLQSGLVGHHDPASVRERLEFNHKVQEQRLLAEERRDWDRLSPDHNQLQAKVQELYRLDRLLQEESGTLQSLQQNKELLEKALGGVRHKLEIARANPAEAERYRKQQKLLERELSKVRMLLAHNSKKLEETVAENARLEQELVVLRQKLVASRRGSQPLQRAPLYTQDGTAMSTTAALEAELRRVQQLVGDLQRQRQELSMQVRQLTEKSHNLVQQIRPGPTGVAGRKRHHSTWLETDLDSMVTLDHGLESPASPQHQTSPPGSKTTASDTRAPLYVNTDANSKREVTEPTYESTMDGGDNIPPPLPAPPEIPPEYPPPPPPPPPPSEEAMMNGSISSGQQYCSQMDISEADDRMKRFYGIIPREKQQEIKTVRIVKRESERRQRDRDRSGNIGIPITNGACPGKRVTVPDDPDNIAAQHLEQQQQLLLQQQQLQQRQQLHIQQQIQQQQQLHSPKHQMQQLSLQQQYQQHLQKPTQVSQEQLSQQKQLGRVLEEDINDAYQFYGDTGEIEDDPILMQFQRSMSLPRGFGKRERLMFHQGAVPPPPPVRVPSPRSDSVTALRNLMMNRHRVRFESGSARSSSTESSNSQRTNSPSNSRPLSAHEQLFGQAQYCMTSPGSSDASPQLSPVFKSEAARAIVMEMSSLRDTNDQPRKRAVPREKRRHHTVSSSRPLLDMESNIPRMGSARSRDDLDMERALRPRLNAPDVVRSTMSHKDFKYNEDTIDSILGTPSKIVIPERYIPEQAPELSAEEQLHRSKKAEAIRKMLSETTLTSSDGKEPEPEEQTSTLKKKLAAEKKQREHILQLNQILAKQVMEKSKIVAGSTPVQPQE